MYSIFDIVRDGAFTFGTSMNMDTGVVLYKNISLTPFPLPEFVDKGTEQTISAKVKEVLAIKRDFPDSDTSILEAEIDRLVYQLYGLTEEEIKLVDGI